MEPTDLPEDHVQFVGNCVCDHTQEEHGWGGCGVDDCVCEAGWEE